MKRLDYTDYLNDILESIRDTIEFTENISFDAFLADKKTINAVIRSLEVLGEASRKIPDDVKNKSHEIPWKRMMQMRNKLIHEYFGVDLEIVWTVIKDELPPLIPHLEKLLPR